MLIAPKKAVNPVIHATVFKAANVNSRPLPGSPRAKALLDRWLDDEIQARETSEYAAMLDNVPEHLF